MNVYSMGKAIEAGYGLRNLIFGVFFFLGFNSQGQEIQSTNTDSLLYKGIELYGQGKFERSIQYTKRGLELAPDYHDHRILKIRNLQALGKIEEATKEIFFLGNRKPDYMGFKDLAYRQANLIGDPKKEVGYLSRILSLYPEDLQLNLLYAEKLFTTGDLTRAREIAQGLEENKHLTGEQRYRIHRLLLGTIRHSMGLDQNIIFFINGYGDRESWHTTVVEYKRMVVRTAILGRIQHFLKGDLSGTLFEIETYPQLGERTYLYLNTGFSNSRVFPDFRASASLYHNLPVNLELEFGGRIVYYDNSLFIGVTGISTYVGKFYLNGRTLLGPKKEGQLIQNYQFNTRYYFKGSENYLYTKLSHGISPDETAVYSQLKDSPSLKVNYVNLGTHFLIGPRHVLRMEAGFLFEDTRSGENGFQFLPSIGYRLRL